MKHTTLLAVACAFAVGTAFADIKEKASHEADPKMEAMMKAWKEYATPGAPHAVLAGMAGSWKYTSKWWETPTSPAQESSGTSKMKMVLGGRFLQNETKGKAMGMPFDGLGLTGYDNLKGKYDTVWLDSMGTGVMHGTGSFDAATNTLKDSGEYSCPMSKNKTRAYRAEWKIVDKKNTIYTMWGPDEDGDEFKQMEMTFKRTR